MARIHTFIVGYCTHPACMALRGAGLATRKFPARAYLLETRSGLYLLDTGYAKLMTPFFPLEKLRKTPGFENARYVDPYAGGKGNSIRYLSVAERDNQMRVTGIENLLCAGEKSGLFIGHTEAISTGTLAGYNSVRYLKGIRPLELPNQIAIGDLISYANEQIRTEDGLMTRYTFAGSEPNGITAIIAYHNNIRNEI